MSTAAVSAVSAIDRFGFTLFFAAAFHVIAILGITFAANKPYKQTTLEITLAQVEHKTAPKKADYIAQINQLGSGTGEEKTLPSSKQQPVPPKDLNIGSLPPTIPSPPKSPKQPPAIAPKQKPAPAPKKEPPKVKVVTTKAVQKQKVKVNKKPVAIMEAPKPKPKTQPSLLSQSLQMAKLQADLDRHRELMAKRPRVKRLTSASTQKREDALYLENWRKKVERIGNLNISNEVGSKNLYGTLRLLVILRPDGSVKEATVLSSSGNTLLDQAAIDIVQLAAPFQPFPTNMKKSTDLLEIIRTWKFEKQAHIY